MFLTVFGQKGGVAKTCTSVHLACVWAQQGHSVCVVDADRNRSATAYAARGMLPFEVVPVEAAAKATRSAQVIITDGQASSHEEELKNLSAGADLVLLPTTPQARSVELTIELSSILRSMDTMHAALLVKVDSRKQRLANDARQTLEGFGVDVLTAEIPLLAAFEKAEVEGVCVSEAVDDRGRADLRRMGGWSAYCAAAVQIRERLKAMDETESMIA
jgi:chromosome partitioning protein